MTLRSQIEALIVDISEDPFLRGAPLDHAAELLRAILDKAPEKPDAPATLPAFVTPCHGAPLYISVRHEAGFGGYGSTEVVDEISCDAPGCPSTWNPDGTVSYAAPVE